MTLLLAVLPIVAVAQGGIDNSLPRDTSHLLVSAVDANPDSALATALQALQGDPLGLSQAIHEAQQHATAAGEAEARLRAAEATVLREKGAFDPQIFGELSRSSSRLPADSPFLGANPLDTRETAASAGASIRLPIGTELGVSAQVLREETNSAYASLNPQYDASGSLDLRQPLLKGFGPSAHSALSAARRDLAAARARRGDALLGVQADAETAYWGLYAAERDYAVQQLIRDSAKALLEQARLRAEAGLVGPEQVANARVFLAEQEQAVLDQRDRLDAASDRMSTLLGRRPAEGDLRFRTLDEPPGDFPSEPADTLVGRALRRNLVLHALAQDVESVRAKERGARWDALPDLSLFGSLGSNGIGGVGRPVVFGTDTLITPSLGGSGRSLRQVFGRDFPTWTAGVRFSVPIGLREGRGERDRLRAEVGAARQVYEAARRSLEEQVRAGQRDLATGQERLDLAKEGVAASLEEVRIGVLSYRSGRTTAFELVRLGADLATAQQRYSQALVRTAQAAARLRQLTAGAYYPVPGVGQE